MIMSTPTFVINIFLLLHAHRKFEPHLQCFSSMRTRQNRSATSFVISAIKLFRFYEQSRWQDCQNAPSYTLAGSPCRTAKMRRSTAIAPITCRCQTLYAVMTVAGDVYQRVISQAWQMVMATSLKASTKMLGPSRWYSHFTDWGLIIGQFISSLCAFMDFLTAS